MFIYFETIKNGPNVTFYQRNRGNVKTYFKCPADFKCFLYYSVLILPINKTTEQSYCKRVFYIYIKIILRGIRARLLFHLLRFSFAALLCLKINKGILRAIVNNILTRIKYLIRCEILFLGPFPVMYVDYNITKRLIKISAHIYEINFRTCWSLSSSKCSSANSNQILLYNKKKRIGFCSSG